MPAKRVSLKGQGADLFFGGNQQARPEEQFPAATAALRSDVPTAAAEIPPVPAPAHLPETNLLADDPPPVPAAEATPGISNGEITDMEQESYRASTIASVNGETIETIRRVVKQTGREVSFVRLSTEEKGRLADIVYTYRRQGRKTTENELNRIAINALLDDYDAHGAQSVLARVLDALHA